MLRLHPFSGRAGRVTDTSVISRTPYVVIYRLLEEVVIIVRVLQGAQQWPPDTAALPDQ